MAPSVAPLLIGSLFYGKRRKCEKYRCWWNNIARDTFREDFANEVDTLIVDVPESDYVLKVLAIE